MSIIIYAALYVSKHLYDTQHLPGLVYQVGPAIVSSKETKDAGRFYGYLPFADPKSGGTFEDVS